MIEQRVKSLIEKRTMEAIRKNLSQKMRTVVKAFGRPVIEQTVSYTSIPDFWELEAPEIPELNDDNISLRGYYFDGLSRGINLTIKLDVYEERTMSMTATWNGFSIYAENEGELRGYHPMPAWEDALDRLYTYAKPAEQDKVHQEKIERKERNQKRAMSILDKLRLLWGI